MRSKTRLGALVSLCFVLALIAGAALPAYAHHRDDHTQGASEEGNGKSDEDHGKSDDEGSTTSASDHDGDADSDSNTAEEDGHEPEPDATPSDNQHPSGKDRSGESGGSGGQGKAESNPDDTKGPKRYEGGLGDDKAANGPGGSDRADQDGNNGCGNDDDFDDDNNGHCGKPDDDGDDDDDEVLPRPPITRNLCPAPSDFPGMEYDDLDECYEDEVQGRTDEVCPAGTTFAGVEMADLDDCVLGTIIRRGTPEEPPAVAPQAVLPFTGAGSVASFLVAGIALITAGLAALKVRSTH